MIVGVDSHEARFVNLVVSFPVLGGRRDLAPAPGVDTLARTVDLVTLDRWAAHDGDVFTNLRGPYPGDAAREAVRFVLNLWSSRHPWKCGRFDLFAALRHWDEDQIGAFRAFVNAPFLP